LASSVVVRCVVGGEALRDIATALSWSAALGESCGLWFGVRFVWAPNGRRADGDITDRLSAVRVRATNASPRGLPTRSGSHAAPHWSPKRPVPHTRGSDVWGGPVWRRQTSPDRPTPTGPMPITQGGPVGRGLTSPNRPTRPGRSGRPTSAESHRTPLTPLGADRPRHTSRFTHALDTRADALPGRSKQSSVGPAASCCTTSVRSVCRSSRHRRNEVDNERLHSELLVVAPAGQESANIAPTLRKRPNPSAQQARVRGPIKE
jgi:hypothetical protein